MSTVMSVDPQLEVNNVLLTHYRKSVEKYLKTVVVVDDRAFSSRKVVEAAAIEDIPSNPLESLALDFEADASDSDVQPEIADEEHELDGPGLVRLFAHRGIVCSVIEPPKFADNAELINEILCVAHAADALVLDWELRQGDHTASLSAIEKIIELDSTNGGRLRFIVVYTAAKQRHVKKAIRQKFSGKVTESGHLMVIGDACVLVLNKVAVAYPEAVPLHKLPDAIFDHHAQYSSGILPATALMAVATARCHTHQVLSRFHKELDAAYMAHRALIPRSEDAELHVIELVADSLYHLMLAEGVRGTLSKEFCTARLRQIQNDLPVADRLSDDAIGRLIECMAGYSDNKISDVRDALNVGGEERSPEKRLLEKLYGDVRVAESRRKEMAFLHDFTRSCSQKNIQENPPRLTMGTVVAILNGEGYDFQMCIQPRCDSVRLDKSRQFPFVKLDVSGQPDVHLFWNGQYRAVSSSEKLYDIKSHSFGSGGEPAIQAELCSVMAEWVFLDSNGGKLYWVGDLRKDKAQRLVSKIASRLHLPGINEYEPTRKS